jgi:hypothetical protein
VADLQLAARAKSVEVPILKASNAGAVDAAFAALADVHTPTR